MTIDKIKTHIVTLSLGYNGLLRLFIHLKKNISLSNSLNPKKRS